MPDCPRCKQLETENAELRAQLARMEQQLSDARWWEKTGPLIAAEREHDPCP